MLNTFNHGSRTRVQDVSQKSLKNVIDSCARFSTVSLNRQIEACEKLLVRNPPIDVTILGQFEAGVDSFINSLRSRLLSTLSLNRDFEFRKILQYKMQSMTRGCLDYFDIALKVG